MAPVERMSLPLSLLVAFLSPIFAGTEMARADEAACKAVLDSVIKQATLPVHQKVVIENAAAPAGKIDSEVIRTGDAIYMQIRDQWKKLPYDPTKATQDARTAMEKSRHECTKVRSETVAGQAADVYAVTSHGPEGDSQSEIWISASSGLPMRQHSEMVVQGHKVRHEVTSDYANVKAPIP